MEKNNELLNEDSFNAYVNTLYKAFTASLNTVYRKGVATAAHNALVKRKKRTDIKKMAKDAIFQYPVLMSDNITLETAKRLCFTLEQEYLTLLKIAMSVDDVIIYDTANPGKAKRDYLSRFYTNLLTLEDGMSDDGDVNESNINESLSNIFDCMLHEDQPLPFVEVADPIKFINYIEENYHIINKDNLTTLREDLNLNTINSMSFSMKTLSEAETKTPANESELKNKEQPTQTVFKGNVNGYNKEEKKTNDRMPSLLIINLKYGSKDNMHDTSIIIGIQCITHYIASNEICYYLAKGLTTKKGLFRIIQWTTGEIRFRDLITNMDLEKREIQTKKYKSKYVWDELTNASEINRLKHIANDPDKILPNATVVLTSDEVDLIKNKYGVDLKAGNNIKKLYELYFLLGFVIINEIDETAYFWDTTRAKLIPYSFGQLAKKESSDSLTTLMKALSTSKGGN